MGSRLRMAVVGCVAALLAGAGCASDRPALRTEAPPAAARADALCDTVAPRARVRVTLRSGEKVAGRVVEVTATELTVEQYGSRQYREVVLARADIARVSLARDASEAGVTVLTVLGLLGLFVAGIAASMQGMN